MDQLLGKRPRHEGRLSDHPAVKRRRLPNDSSHPLPTCIEDFSNELFYEIFDYLNHPDGFQAFFNLNQRFNELIRSSSSQIKVCSWPSSLRISTEYYEQVIQYNKHRIFSLHLYDSCCSMHFLYQTYINSSFNHLQSLILHGLDYDTLASILIDIYDLPVLYSLTIIGSGVFRYRKEIHRLCFRLPALRHYYLSNSFDRIYGRSESHEHFIDSVSPIQNLTIDCYLYLHDIICMIPYLPDLRRLTLYKPFVIPLTIDDIPIRRSPLTHLTMKHCDMDYNTLEVLIKKLCPLIQSLRLGGCQDIDYLDADRWQKLIVKHMPRLKTFHCEYEERIFQEPSPRAAHLLVQRFLSPFWVEKRWIFALQIRMDHQPAKMIYTISPLKQQWYESMESNDNQNTVHSYLHLLLDDWGHLLFSGNLLEFIRAILRPTSITDLRIDFQTFSRNNLLECLRMMPHLRSLTVTSTIAETFSDPTQKYLNPRNLISNSNRITKVNLEKMVELDQVYLLMQICPHMTDFQVHCRTEQDLHWFIRYAIHARKLQIVPYLHSLYLLIDQADERAMDKVRCMINREQLLTQFILKRCGDRLDLHWNNE